MTDTATILTTALHMVRTGKPICPALMAAAEQHHAGISAQYEAYHAAQDAVLAVLGHPAGAIGLIAAWEVQPRRRQHEVRELMQKAIAGCGVTR